MAVIITNDSGELQADGVAVPSQIQKDILSEIKQSGKIMAELKALQIRANASRDRLLMLATDFGGAEFFEGLITFGQNDFTNKFSADTYLGISDVGWQYANINYTDIALDNGFNPASETSALTAEGILAFNRAKK